MYQEPFKPTSFKKYEENFNLGIFEKSLNNMIEIASEMFKTEIAKATMQETTPYIAELEMKLPDWEEMK